MRVLPEQTAFELPKFHPAYPQNDTPRAALRGSVIEAQFVPRQQWTPDTDRRTITADHHFHKRFQHIQHTTPTWQYRNIVSDSTGTRTLPVSWAPMICVVSLPER
jgi:hypothetical protein